MLLPPTSTSILHYEENVDAPLCHCRRRHSDNPGRSSSAPRPFVSTKGSEHDTILAGKTALVTGASSGLGVAFAHELAVRGANLVIAARREERLRQVASDLHNRHGVTITEVPLDLSDAAARTSLFDRLVASGTIIDVLVNNAGRGAFGDFLTIPWHSERDLLEVDVLALVHLTKLFVPGMISRGFGYVLNLASTASFQPTPLQATYGAAKAFVLSLSEAISYELRGTGVSVTAVCPGPTDTEFFAIGGRGPTAFEKRSLMRSDRVARLAVHAALKCRRSVVPGASNRIGALAGRFLPRSISLPVVERLLRPNPPARS